MLVAFFGGGGVDFAGYAYEACNRSCLGLGAAHATESGRNKELALERTLSKLTSRIHQGNGGSVHNTLRADVHVAAGRHLSVLTDAQCIKSF